MKSEHAATLSQVLTSVDAWLFDLDGTLVDSFEPCHKAMNLYLQQYGASVTPDWNRAHFSNTIEQVLIAVAQDCHFVFNEPLRKEVERLEHLIVANSDMTQIYPGAIDCLRWFRDRDWRVGFVTAGTHDEGWANTEVLQSAYGTELSMVDFVVTNDDVAQPKPHRASLDRCCELLELTDCSRLVYVGDSDRDIQMMKQSGVDAHAIYVECTKPFAAITTDTPRPDLILRDVEHLYELLREIEP